MEQSTASQSMEQRPPQPSSENPELQKVRSEKNGNLDF